MSTPDPTITDFTDVDPYLSYDVTTGVRPVTSIAPTAWLYRLAATADPMAARSVLRQVIALAEQAPELTDEQLRVRLAALGELVR